MPRRVVIVAESPLSRSGLRSVLSELPELEIAGEAERLDLADFPDSELVVWELAAVNRTLLEQLRELGATNEAVVLAPPAASVGDLVAAGARGVLWREVDPERLRRAMLAVLSGATVLDEGMAELLLERKVAEPAAEGLTPRELEVLGLMAEGLSNKLIAARLGISEHTAKFHVNALLDKLGADTRTEAVVRAARRGLLML